MQRPVARPKGDDGGPQAVFAVRGAAPSLGYTIALWLFFGVGLIAAHRFFPAAQAVRVLECDLPLEPNTMVITVDRRGERVIAQCVQVSARGAYGKEGRR